MDDEIAIGPVPVTVSRNIMLISFGSKVSDPKEAPPIHSLYIS
jgi:hypothetical protein